MKTKINLYNEDCMPAMEKMKDNQYDLAIIDPPYGIKIGGKSGGKTERDKPFGKGGFERAGKNKKVDATIYRVFKDDKPPDRKFFKEIIRISRNQIMFGANHFISNIPFDSSCWIVWDKDNSGNFADAELAWTSFKTSVRIFQFRWNGMLQEHMKYKEIRIHPTQKPIALYRWLLKNYAKPGETILDTHGGSMSIAIACFDMGHDLDLYEIDKDYFEAGKKRFENHMKQIRLF